MSSHLLDGIHVCQWGHEGPRVVMVHGGAQGTSSAGHRNYRDQEILGSQGWQLIVPDRPGHGLSPDPGRPDDAHADGEWVAELLGDGAHLVGHSFGGLVALAATHKRPEAVRSLTLIEPALLKVAAHKPAVRKMLFGMAKAFILPYSAETKAIKIMKILGIPDEFALAKDDLKSLGSSLKKADLPPRKQMNDWLAHVRARQIPCLVVSGSSAGFQAVGEVSAEKAGGRHTISPIDHHFPQWNGAPFNALLTDFWTQADAAKGR
ncbi:MAG TPA: alpha/beta hydrolase [Chakrabartia sp.]|jgi:pimeloyl-ACP methyl ester carboxylesterase|nr:alpha/beta hydrolase [Chakrabartia sp.]